METGASYLEAVRPRPGLSLPPLMPHSASATHGLSQLEQYLFVSGRLEDGGESPAGGREGEVMKQKVKLQGNVKLMVQLNQPDHQRGPVPSIGSIS